MCKNCVLPPALILSLCLAPTQAQESYIAVHVHNPEGVEIASIEGMDPSCVDIFDGEDWIDYAPYNADTHCVPLPIAPGHHTIKAAFNGMTATETVELAPGETESVIFTFERTEIDIQSLMTTSGSAHGSSSQSVGPGVSLWNTGLEINEGPPGEHYYDYVSRGRVTWMFRRLDYVGDPPLLSWTIASHYDWVLTPREFSVTNAGTTIEFSPPDGGSVVRSAAEMQFYGIDVSSVFSGPFPFETWIVQQAIPYEYGYEDAEPPDAYPNIAALFLRGPGRYDTDRVQIAPGQQWLRNGLSVKAQAC